VSERAARAAYAALVAALFAAVAAWRWDLVQQAWFTTGLTLARGGPGRWKVLGEIVLFAAILAAAWRAIPATARPARDVPVLLLATLAGWAAEAWGTRLGLWRYYTGERPPLWIVPAWPLGAAVVDRLAAAMRARWGPAPAAAYWCAAAAALATCACFCAPWLGRPAAWAGLAAAAAAVAAGPDAAADFWTLAAGLGAVFFADLWGTTNGCWTYYLAGRPGGLWRGIAFGMAFDASVVLGCLRLARVLERGKK
jgi:hypothetical protein